MLNKLNMPPGANKRRKRKGRGPSSGHGKTSGRGHKGQRARSGRDFRPGFEGGQMPLMRRIPKRGFTSKFKRIFEIVNLKDLKKFKDNDTVSAKELKDLNLINTLRRPVKILGDGEIQKPLALKIDAISKSAREKIEKAGGKVELIK